MKLFILENISTEQTKLKVGKKKDKILSKKEAKEYRLFGIYSLPHKVSIDAFKNLVVCYCNPPIDKNNLNMSDDLPISAQEFYKIIRAIAEINGSKDDLQKCAKKKSLKKATSGEKELVNEELHNTNQKEVETFKPFSFSDLGIKKDDEIYFSLDDSVIAKVVDNEHVEYLGKRYTLSQLLYQLGITTDFKTTLTFFKHEGRRLSEIKK